MRRTTVIGIVLLVVGVPLGILLIVVAVRSTATRVDALQRVPYPAGGPVQVAAAGDVTVYAELDELVGKQTDGPTALIVLTGPDGQAVAARPYDSSVSYNLGGHHGIAIASASLPGAGTYAVSTRGAEPAERFVDLAVGEAVITPATFVLPLVAGILVLVGALVSGILTIVLGAVRSRSHVISTGPTAGPDAGPSAGTPSP